MQEQALAPNETLQLHELLTINNLCLTKAITMSPLVSDEELKALVKNNIQVTQNHIKDLWNFLEQSMIASSSAAERQE